MPDLDLKEIEKLCEPVERGGQHAGGPGMTTYKRALKCAEVLPLLIARIRELEALNVQAKLNGIPEMEMRIQELERMKK